MKKLTAAVFICLFMASCIIETTYKWQEDEGEGNFWAYNFVTGIDYRINAEIMAENEFCAVWVEEGNTEGITYAQTVADEFKDNIYSKILSAFGSEHTLNLTGEEELEGDTMFFADYFGDGDGKLAILLLDIKDSFNPPETRGYIAGYFWAGDFVNVPGSNMRDMIYIDTNPGLNSASARQSAYATLAHEMQHLMNFITSVLKRSTVNAQGQIVPVFTDLWIDEGLSSAADYLYAGDHGTEETGSRWSWYNEDPTGWIAQGNNFFLWDNYTNSPDSVLDDYATVYLFFQWLRLQTSGEHEANDIWKSIAQSEHSDYKAVVNAAAEYFGSNFYNAAAPQDNWGNLLKDWLAANYINSDTGLYGYKDEEGLRELKAHYLPSNDPTDTTFLFFPGEGVYSYVDILEYNVPSPGTGSNANIRYAGLNSGEVVNSGEITEAGALLTFNINTVSTGTLEEGTVTGAAPPAANIRSSTRIGAGYLDRPYAISAYDMLRRNGFDSAVFTAPVIYIPTVRSRD